MGQEIEVRPGVVSKDANGKIHCRPIQSKVSTLLAEKNQLQFAVPGGLIGVGTRKFISCFFSWDWYWNLTLLELASL